MPKYILSDDQFIESWKKIGSPQKFAEFHKYDVRAVYNRRRSIETRLGIKLPSSPKAPPPSPVKKLEQVIGNARRGINMEKGRVVVFSDAHFWPDDYTTAYKALLLIIKEFKPKVVVANGDIFDGSQNSRHPRIGWTHSPTVKEELEACQEFMANIEKAAKGAQLVWPIGNHDCLDSETECLTKRGWLKYDEIELTDEILSIDGKKAIWTKINEIVTYPYIGDLIRIEKTRMSMAVTPNHRVLLDRQNWRTGIHKIREYRRANNLPSSFNIPMAANVEEEEYPIDDDMIRLCGWLLTDGCYEKNGISIYQSKISGKKEIERILDSLSLDYSLYTRNRDIQSICGKELKNPVLPQSQYRFKTNASKTIKQFIPRKKELPEWAFQLNTRQFNILLEALIAGDGCWDGNVENKKCCVLYGEKQILSHVQALALCHGWRARLAIDNRGSLRLCLAKEPKLRIEKKEVFKEHYEGTVWCLKVPYTNFMVRRNGTAYFTGNCRFETFLAAQAPQYEGVSGFTLKDHFPLWQPCWSFWVNEDTCIKHRWKGGFGAGRANALNAGVNMVTGHTHNLAVQPLTDYNGTRYGVQTGTLADPYAEQFLHYTEDGPKDWRSGFALLSWEKGKLLMPELIQVFDDEHIEFRGCLTKV